MADTVRHKRSGEIVFDHRFFTHIGDDLMFTQQFGDALMELDMVIHIADACFHGGDQRQLLIIYVFHQLCVVVVAFADRYGLDQPHSR